MLTKYTYDKIGRLTRVNDQTDTTADTTGTTWLFTYDLGGNILTKKAYAYTTESVSGLTPTESHTYTYGNSGWKDQLTKLDGTGITYDSIGNPTNDGTWAYTWEHGKQLKQMSRTGETVSFEYNEEGLRTKKTATSTGVTEYILHGKNITHMTQGSHALHFYYDAQGKPGIVIYDGTAYGYLHNLQGDVVALVNGSGTKVVEYTYDAWGKPTGKTGTMAGTLGTVQPFRYRGYVFDEETGLYYLRSRYYKPEWCRFVNADSTLSRNLFCYCNNLPTMLYDPTGEIAVEMYLDALLGNESKRTYTGTGVAEQVASTFADSQLLTRIFPRIVDSMEDDGSFAISVSEEDYNGIWYLDGSDFDLYAGIRSFNLTGKISEYPKSTSQNARIMRLFGFDVFEKEFTMEDDYDFHKLQGNKNENAVVAWVNDTFGYNLQENGILTTFHWTLTANILVCVNKQKMYFMMEK